MPLVGYPDGQLDDAKMNMVETARDDRGMTILSVAYPLFPVGSDSGGGAEQILSLLERAITEAGHRSIVIAADGSRVTGSLIGTPVATGEITDDRRMQAQHAHLQRINRVLAEYEVDLIHFHGLDFDRYIPDTHVPMLATLHLPLDWFAKSIFSNPKLTLNCVSRAQAANSGFPVIGNGVDTARYHPSQRKGEYLLWLGRICPEKGVHLALRAAHKLEMPLIVAGPVHPFKWHEDYFANEVEPLLDSKRRYIGSVAGAAKAKLLAEARCVLVTSLAAETSSLVAMEAISSGTPVAALGSGALPEVVDHGVTGVIASCADELGDAVLARMRHFFRNLSPDSHSAFRFPKDGKRLSRFIHPNFRDGLGTPGKLILFFAAQEIPMRVTVRESPLERFI